MMVAAHGEEREVVAVVRTTDDDGNEVVTFWTRLPDGNIAPWSASECKVTAE